MIFIEHASFDDTTIKSSFGAPEYSYTFVKNAFRPVIEALGTRVTVTDPAREVNAIAYAARAQGEECVFLSFNPPHKTVHGLACRTIPVFAWEYDTIPDETWNANPMNDWRVGLSLTGAAITHCRSAAEAVRRSMGPDYPIWVAPAPLFDRFNSASTPARGWRDPFTLALGGAVAINAGKADLSLFRPERRMADAEAALRLVARLAAQPDRPSQPLHLSGVIYTSVLCPTDGRKNWPSMLAGFIWAFRNTPDATLILKLSHASIEDGLYEILRELSTFGAFACNIILVHGLLSSDAYRMLIDATSYAVNASYGEGQCLPLMEYMSCGRPSVAPAHSAMRDYIAPDNAFVVASEAQPACWPQDERAVFRCLHHRVSLQDLVRQFRESYRIARDLPEQYERMSGAATHAARAFCSQEVVTATLVDMLAWLAASATSKRRSA
jgi:glycosyltransferase involved in cell wall biosynthesis